MRHLHAIAFSVFFTACPAEAQDASVFGMALRHPLHVSECHGRHITRDLVIYDPPTDSPCYEALDDAQKLKGSLPAEATVSVKFPYDKSPEIVKGDSVIVGILDGTIQSFGFNTLGLESQERDFLILQNKFGPTTHVDHPSLQNSYGAQFTGTVARWDLPDDVTVYYNASEDGAHTGFVRVETKESAARTQAILEAMHKHNTPL